MWEDTSVNTPDTHCKKIHSGGEAARMLARLLQRPSPVRREHPDADLLDDSLHHMPAAGGAPWRPSVFLPGFSETPALVLSAPPPFSHRSTSPSLSPDG